MATFKNKPTKVPQLHVIPTEVSPSLRQWMVDIQEALEIRLGRRGDQRDRAVTLRELIESGLAKDLTNRPYDPNADTSVDFIGNIHYRGPEDLAIPPVPSGLTATGAFTTIKLTWNAGYSVYGNHSYTKVFRHSSNTLGDAIEIAAPGKYHGGYLDEVGYGQTYYYWIRHVSVAGVEGPYSNSVTASTVADIGATMAALSETLADLPGYSLLQTAATTIEIIQASGVPDENTNRADNTDPHVGDIYVNTATGQQYVRNAANNGWIIAVDAALTTTVSSQASSISTNASAISTANTNISNLTTTSSAHTTSINSLNSTVAAKVDVYRQSAAPSGGTYVSGDLWVDTDDNQLYQYNGSAWVTARDAGLATATALNTVSSTASTNASNVSTLQTTTATLTGDAAAAYVLNVNANGSVAGMVIEANASSSGDNVGSAIQFMADKFAIWNATGSDSGSAAVAPFIVDSGIVYMDIARIKDGAITSAKIGTLVADKIDAGVIDGYSVSGVSVSGDTINAGQIRAERLGVGNINASISMSSPVISGGNITGQTITAGTLNVANGAQSNTIGKIEAKAGASVWMPNNFAGSGDQPGSNYGLFYADTFGSGANPYHHRSSSQTGGEFWLPIISNGGATAGIPIVVPNIRASVTALSITNAGSGYSTDGSLVISFSGGGGTGAAAYAVVAGGAIAKAYLTDGAVSSIAMANSGVGYSSAPTVAFSGGGGSGAAGTAVISNTVVTSITITNAGSGYTTAPTIAFSGGGTGTVTETHVTNPGSGYTSAPTVAFSSGAAAATATISGGAVSQANSTADRITYFVEWNADMFGSFDGDESMWTVCSISTADAWNTNSNWWMTGGSNAGTDDDSGAGWAWSGYGSFTVDLDVGDTYYLWVFGFQHNTMPNTNNGTRRMQATPKWFAMYK